jgi:hypothetical protein
MDMNDISILSLLSKLIDDEEQAIILKLIAEDNFGKELLEKLLVINEEQ